eukprot:1000661-Amphidinium_carterae.2
MLGWFLCCLSVEIGDHLCSVLLIHVDVCGDNRVVVEMSLLVLRSVQDRFSQSLSICSLDLHVRSDADRLWVFHLIVLPAFGTVDPKPSTCANSYCVLASSSTLQCSTVSSRSVVWTTVK